ncbi:MAG: dephospho-CoA kinase [bacterium]
MLIGLTGNIGCGKSLVAGIMKERGLPVIDADRLAREAVEPDEPAWRDILKLFGQEILLPGGQLDRKRLGTIIFADRKKRELLNGIVHPRVWEKQSRLIKRIRQDSPEALIVLNVPLLMETGQDRSMDKVVVVAASRENCLKRIISRDRLTPEEAQQRFDSQMPLEEKIASADFVIRNNGTEEEVVFQVDSILAVLCPQNFS